LVLPRCSELRFTGVQEARSGPQRSAADRLIGNA
jgi:hypothetical protein